LPIPVIRALRKLGHDIRDARRRRRIPVAILAERASISRMTLNRVEKGDPRVSAGAYATVLFALGMADRLADVADPRHDTVGLQLEEERLPERIRLSRRRKPAKPGRTGGKRVGKTRRGKTRQPELRDFLAGNGGNGNSAELPHCRELHRTRLVGDPEDEGAQFSSARQDRRAHDSPVTSTMQASIAENGEAG
jgi:transcriptional regulator with XRE-family HTH domain